MLWLYCTYRRCFCFCSCFSVSAVVVVVSVSVFAVVAVVVVVVVSVVVVVAAVMKTGNLISSGNKNKIELLLVASTQVI